MHKTGVIDKDATIGFTSDRFENHEAFTQPVWLNENERSNPSAVIEAFFLFSSLQQLRMTIHQLKSLAIQDDEISDNGLERMILIQFLLELELLLEAVYLKYVTEKNGRKDP